MMAKYLTTLLSLLTCISVAQKTFNFSIQGTLKNAQENSNIYIQHKWNKKNVIDSAKIKGGKFLFNGKSPESNMYWITRTSNPNEQPNLIFFIDAGKITINGNIDSLAYSQVSGGSSQKDYIEYNTLMQGFAQRQQIIINSYNEARNKGDGTTMNTKAAEYQAMETEVKAAMEVFIKNHPKSAVSGYAIYYHSQQPNVTFDELERMVSLLDKSVLNTKFGELAQEKVVAQRGTAIGYPATNFAQPTPEGKMVNLNEFKGKYVLVDFWASWCAPCRAENPNVVAAYNKYKDKDFTVLGVSFDQVKDRWVQAISADNLTWTHVSDLKGWGNEAGKLFNITSIPQNLLLDKEGKIVAKNLRGADLEKKLEEIIK